MRYLKLLLLLAVIVATFWHSTPVLAANVYATLNPSDKSASVTLSGGNLTAVGSGLWHSVRATQGLSSGKWYWEVTATTVGGSGVFAGGVMTSGGNLESFPGSDLLGYGYHAASGDFFHNGDTGTPAVTYTSGDVIGIALDMDGGKLDFYKNNVHVGSQQTGLSGTYFPALSPGTSAQGSTVTANFGATALTYTPPTGYNAGVYTVSTATRRIFPGIAR